MIAPSLAQLLKLDEVNFRQFFSGSPIKRIGRDRFIRNVLIAAGNSNDLSLIAEVKIHLNDLSPLVRAMAVWALGQLSKNEFAQERKNAAETDIDVLKEWNLQ